MGVSENRNVQERENQDQKWEKDFDDEEAEALSLCDLPVVGWGSRESNESSSSGGGGSLALEGEDFEFGSWVEDPILMCAADDVFYQGQILPLRASVSSEGGLLSGFRPNSQKSSRSGSRSESMDRSSGNGSWVFSSSSGGSTSNRSSSRSHSLSSSSSNNSTFKLHTDASPKPQKMGSQLRRNAAKTSTKSSGLGLFRFGLIRTPEIELQLQDLKLRKRNSGRNCNKNVSDNRDCSGRKSGNSECNDGEMLLQKKQVEQRQGLQRFFSGGLSCKCSADAVDTVSSRILILKSRKEVGNEGFGKQALSHRRTFEWLKDLSIPDPPVA